ncbi:hypothetical protein HZC53_04185 [Candidatus Uhrbacteria bacterium]|nr:hypothetical protein [Candidatus Uhrbacteria bacterium]
MSQPLSAHKVGLSVGGFLGLFHLAWSFLVALGFAQALLDMVFNMHMIRPAFMVMPFSWIYSLALVVLTSIFGYVVGYVFSMVWNWVHMS